MKYLSVTSILLLLAIMVGCSEEVVPTDPLGDSSTAYTDELGKTGLPGEPVLNPENGNYYLAVAAPQIDWSDALAASAMKYRGCNGHLATITSAEESAFIGGLTDGRYWLGGAQDPAFGEPDNGWGWITGEPFVYTNWAPGEPNDLAESGQPEDLLHLVGSWGPHHSQWNDIAANESSLIEGYVAEFDCPPNGSVVERITGSGHFTWLDELRTFSFNARKYADGTVKGEWQLNNRSVDAKAHGNVTCFVVEGDQAWIGGFTEQGIPGDVGWTVVDNSEGAASPPDQISFQWAGGSPGFASAYCTATPEGSEVYALPLNDVEAGNIQLH